MTDTGEYQDKEIICVDCNEPFVWSSGAQAFFSDKGLLNSPKRCYVCKKAKTERLAAITAGRSQKIEVVIDCAQCGKETTVPFYPSQGKPVYCRSCFLAMKEEADRMESLL
jgi:CxxC-x17-CxxC domain-containing protein